MNLVTILLVIYSRKCAASMFSDLKLSFYNMQGSIEQLKFRISQNLWHRKVAMSNFFLLFLFFFWGNIYNLVQSQARDWTPTEASITFFSFFKYMNSNKIRTSWKYKAKKQLFMCVRLTSITSGLILVLNFSPSLHPLFILKHNVMPINPFGVMFLYQKICICMTSIGCHAILWD